MTPSCFGVPCLSNTRQGHVSPPLKESSATVRLAFFPCYPCRMTCTRSLLLAAAIALPCCHSESRAASQGVDDTRNPGEILLDLRDDARLYAMVQPVPAQSDAPRTLMVRWVKQGQAQPASWAFADSPVLDARLVPHSEAIIVVTQNRDLMLLTSIDASPVVLDSRVHPPLSLSENGQFLAYAQGVIPDLEITRFDLNKRSRLESTQNMAPAWSPALSENGSRLLFVSGSTGYPELWEYRGNQAVRLTDRNLTPIPFPSGPTAPIWNGNTIVFEDTTGVHLLSIEPLRLLGSLQGTLPVGVPRSQRFIVQDTTENRWRWMSFDGTEVTP